MTFTTGKLVTAILLSSIISVASTVTVINYAPNLVAMPIQQPDIQLASVSLTSSFRCEPRSDWTTIDELTKTINVRQDSVLVIIFSSKVHTSYTLNLPEADAVIHLNAYVNEYLAKPQEVTISYLDEDNGKVTTAVFHYSYVSTGSHTVSFQWYNSGSNPGHIDDPVVEIFIVPLSNTS